MVGGFGVGRSLVVCCCAFLICCVSDCIVRFWCFDSSCRFVWRFGVRGCLFGVWFAFVVGVVGSCMLLWFWCLVWWCCQLFGSVLDCVVVGRLFAAGWCIVYDCCGFMINSVVHLRSLICGFVFVICLMFMVQLVVL